MIYIVNGFPCSGKTTFEDIVTTLIGGEPVVYKLSTVDFVKQIAKECGWDGTKTPETRKFLCDLKNLLTDWNDVPFKKIVEKIFYIRTNEFFDDGKFEEKSLIFIDCREPKEIDKIKKTFAAKTILVRRESIENIEEISNEADLNVLNYNYDIVINNNGSMVNLVEEAFKFIEQEGYTPYRNFQITLDGNLK